MSKACLIWIALLNCYPNIPNMGWWYSGQGAGFGPVTCCLDTINSLRVGWLRKVLLFKMSVLVTFILMVLWVRQPSQASRCWLQQCSAVWGPPEWDIVSQPRPHWPKVDPDLLYHKQTSISQTIIRFLGEKLSVISKSNVATQPYEGHCAVLGNPCLDFTRYFTRFIGRIKWQGWGGNMYAPQNSLEEAYIANVMKWNHVLNSVFLLIILWSRLNARGKLMHRIA